MAGYFGNINFKFTGLPWVFAVCLLCLSGVALAQPEPNTNIGLIPELLGDITNSPGGDRNSDFGVRPQLGQLGRGIVDLPYDPQQAIESSLLFYPNQMRLIRDFERGILFPKPDSTPTPVVKEMPDLAAPPKRLRPAPRPEEQKTYVPPTVPSPRELYLAGIAFNNKENWTIWLNGQRLTPDTVPEEIFNISVQEEFIEIIWHDKQTHRVYPIRLRPNQRFNLDARMFLPGRKS